jgi:chemotaxis signal transduction protein
MNSRSRSQRTEAIFEERARNLAKPFADAGGISSHSQALLVQAGGEQYAVEVRHLAEVMTGRLCARIPGAAAEIEGLLSFRGRVIPVVNLSALLGSRAEHTPGPRPVVIVRGPSRNAGVAVDRIGELITTPRQAERSLRGPDPTEPTRYVYRVQDGFWVIRMEALLSHPIMKGVFGA